jgi:hypothetical protein
MEVIRQILDLARWAPSGDNTQPWRFEITAEDSLVVHGYDTRDHCVYDLDGYASHLAHGAVLETIALAASRFGERAEISVADAGDPTHVKYRVLLRKEPSAAEDPLVTAIRDRTVQRRSMPGSPLSTEQQHALVESVDGYQLLLLQKAKDRWRMAALNARNAGIRLTIPEAYQVHKAVIAWDSRTSEDRMPDASLGAGPMLLAMMRSAMSSWDRVQLLNRFAGGTLLPRLMLDLLPGLRCSAHFALIAPDEPRDIAQRMDAGRAIQRLWLTATRLGLQMQPSYTPLVFARYAREDRRFTESSRAQRTANEVARRLEDFLGTANARNAIFLGRLGPARSVPGRSLRLPLDRLIVDSAPRTLAKTPAER